MAAKVFGLACAVLECEEGMSLDEFGRGILVGGEEEEDEGRIANVVVARELNRASEQVQIQALEVRLSSVCVVLGMVLLMVE